MSGIYIPGVKMPESCGECPAYWEQCGVDKDAVEEGYRTDRERHPDCPLDTLPPHGLISRAQILDAIRLELTQANAVNDMEDYAAWMRVFDYVRKFPTVIPADKEGE